jgi:MFS-type transporter involved in bile tolerance (Atg22 family)
MISMIFTCVIFPGGGRHRLCRSRRMLQPEATISSEALARGRRALVQDAAWASLTGALSGGVVLVALALSFGAGPASIGLLGAIPFLAQGAQLAGLVLVERLRQRKRIGVWALAVARGLIFALALLPLLPWPDARLPLLVAAQFAIALLGSLAGCAINAWLHQLLPPQGLGQFFARRLLVSTVAACVGTLAVGVAVDAVPPQQAAWVYALAMAAAGLAGALSTWALVRTPEPQMLPAGPAVSVWSQLRAPFADPSFRPLLAMLGGWGFASNLAAPFFAVYLIQQLQYGLGTVTGLWVASQAANALTVFAWGRVSDRLSNKSVLAVAMPAWFACVLALVFVAFGPPDGLQLALLLFVHLVMGAAGGGIGLATGNLGLKLAPRDRGASYLAAIGLVSAAAGGLAPLLGGQLAQWFEDRRLALVVRWVAPGGGGEVSVASFAHWGFLFLLSALLGMAVLHALSRVREGAEVSERRVMQEFGLEALRTLNQLSSAGGMLGSLFSFRRLGERRRTPR